MEDGPRNKFVERETEGFSWPLKRLKENVGALKVPKGG